MSTDTVEPATVARSGGTMARSEEMVADPADTFERLCPVARLFPVDRLHRAAAAVAAARAPEPARDHDAPVASLVYRSRATRPVDGRTLAALLQAARLRNRAENITGLLLYDGGHFLQWLEGPPEGLNRVVRSIRSDPRHGEIEILGEAARTRRTFAGWDMKLATEGQLSPVPADSVSLPRGILDALAADPGNTGRLLPFLVDEDPVRAGGPAGALGGTGAAAEREDLLREAVNLAVRARLEGEFPGLNRLLERERVIRAAQELARLAVTGQEAEAHDLIVSECTAGDPFAACASLLEPAAEALGDLWSREECSELDVTISLCLLQTEFRRLCGPLPLPWEARGEERSVLVASAPGEWDSLGPALAAESLWRAGFAVELDYPQTEDALLDDVRHRAFDAVHLSTSPVFRRQERLAQLAEIVAHLRAASLNSALQVLVSGRIFREDAAAASLVGADAAAATSVRLDRMLAGEASGRTA